MPEVPGVMGFIIFYKWNPARHRTYKGLYVWQPLYETHYGVRIYPSLERAWTMIEEHRQLFRGMWIYRVATVTMPGEDTEYSV